MDVIYIDPPYNTGKEGWAYNDNVNSPLMKQWFSKEVDLDDLERHDKWLCMMWPRLNLLLELLRDDGVFFCSIDDNEMHHLRLLLDDVFGSKNFLGQISVMVNPKGRGLKDSDFAKTHEYLVCYQKHDRTETIGKRKSDEQIDKEYKYTDVNGVKFRLLELRNTHKEFGQHNRENLYFPFYVEPVTGDQVGKVYLESKPGLEKVVPDWDNGFKGCWTWDKRKAAKDIDQLRVRLVEGRHKIYRISYSKTFDGESVKQKTKTIWQDSLYFTEAGSADFAEFAIKEKFETPKPVRYLKDIFSLIDREDFIMLDSFAGSASSAQAILDLNYQDGGNRKFILIEMQDFANKLTAERVRRSIIGVPKARDEALKKGLGGSFTYCELGEPLDLQRFFEGKTTPSWEQVARYVVYTATGVSLAESPKQPDDTWYVGEAQGTRIHLIYKPDLSWMKSSDAALTEDMVEKIIKTAKGKPVLIYGAQKFMGHRNLLAKNITFCQLPYSIYRILGGGTDAA